MEPIEYLRIFRRRIGLIAAAALVAGAVVFLTTPPTAELEPRTTYTSTHTLYRDPVGPQSGSISLDTMALLATIGEIPRRVTSFIAPDTEPAILAAEVTVTADTRLGTLRFASSGESPERTELLANGFAEETLRFFDEREESRRVSAITRITDDITRRENRVRELDGELAQLAPVGPDGQRPTILGADAELVRAERDAAIRQYGVAVEQLSQLESQQAVGTGLVTLETAVPVPQVEGGFQAPTNRGTRTLLATLVGLVLGLVLAIASDRLDTRVRSRRAAEQAFELPVIAEVPRFRAHKYDIITATRPASFAAEPYRIMRLTLQLSGRAQPPANGHDTPAASQGEAQIVLVTSAGPAEGKTTSVANLAVSFAEVGKRVLVIDADFRNAQQHRYFGVGREPGLTDYLGAGRDGAPRGLAEFSHRSSVPGVSVVPNGTFAENPGELFGRDNLLLVEAADIADVIIIDAGPILAVNEPQALMPQVDSVVLIARSGKTEAESARRTTDLLERLDAPVVGVALVDVPRNATGQPYYAQVRSLPVDVRRTWQVRRNPARGRGRQGDQEERTSSSRGG